LVILTRHNHHARQVISALKNHKAVYCEKPLALHPDEIDEIESLLKEADTPLLTVGYNRRFAPMALELTQFIQARSEPVFIQYRVNAGFLPITHWLHDPDQGGGRIIGEGCHFIDFLTFLVGAPPTAISAVGLPDHEKYHQDNVLMTLKYPDGSVGTISYLANGNKNSSKERVEVFTGGRIAVLDDFRSLERITESSRKQSRSRLRQDKGHSASWQRFLQAVRTGGQPPIPYQQLLSTSRASFAAMESLRLGKEIDL
ncbi:MAG TPA: Gfo/Idh/MocA family oxidoreductase, partial [Anaerolineaceae bacterium]|nr:Gfo/Idh/MocA family oxidoreductase [Anaerolineaceae bacterium]